MCPPPLLPPLPLLLLRLHFNFHFVINFWFLSTFNALPPRNSGNLTLNRVQKRLSRRLHTNPSNPTPTPTPIWDDLNRYVPLRSHVAYGSSSRAQLKLDPSSWKGACAASCDLQPGLRVPCSMFHVPCSMFDRVSAVFLLLLRAALAVALLLQHWGEGAEPVRGCCSLPSAKLKQNMRFVCLQADSGVCPGKGNYSAKEGILARVGK